MSDEKILIGRLGKMGSILWSFANGYDDSPVKIENTSAPVKSVGNSTTTPKDMETDEYEKQQFSPDYFQKPLRSIEIRGTDLVTDYFWEQLDLFTDPGFREKQMKMDDAVDVIRRRFGFYSIQRGLMYRDRILSACDAKADHTVHPHGYFG